MAKKDLTPGETLAGKILSGYKPTDKEVQSLAGFALNLIEPDAPPLSPEVLAMRLRIEKQRDAVLAVYDEILPSMYPSGGKYIALARTALEQSAMWAIKEVVS